MGGPQTPTGLVGNHGTCRRFAWGKETPLDAASRPTRVHVRPADPADPEDRAFLLAQAPRVTAGAPAWYRPDEIGEAMQRSLAAALAAKDATTVILLAVDAQGAQLGFVYAWLTADLFTNAPQAHISDLVVAAAAEGQGVGRLLLDAIETWAMGRGAHSITLHVFPANARALGLYTRLGYATQWLQLYKPLATDESKV